MKPIPRRSHGEGFGPAKLRESVDIPIVLDNLICAVCQKPLDLVGGGWTVVSSPKHKGIVVFACKKDISGAMNLLGKAVVGLKTVPEGLEIPSESQN